MIILRLSTHHTGGKCLKGAFFGLQLTMITNVQNWQKKIYQHLVKIPEKDKERAHY